MRYTKCELLLSIALAAACVCADGELEPVDLSGIDASKTIAGTTAAGTPSAYTDRGAVYAFNGAGMNGNAHGTTANKEMFMFSSNNSGSFPWYIQVDLGEIRRIDAVRLYNFNFAANGNNYTERGVRDFELYVSTDDTWMTSAASIKANYTCVLSNQLAQASGTASYAGEFFELAAPANARFVALVAYDDFDARTPMNYNGISEIQLFAAVEPFGALVEAESFTTKGGWVVDPQFADVMGSPYLLAHGKGVPVENATTTVRFGATGQVRAWVRTRDWTPDWDGEKPGRFALALDGVEFPNELGVAPMDWGWADAGVLPVEKGLHTVALVDRTGFEGRCDAVYFTSAAATNPPPNDAASLAAWRAAKRGETAAPDDVLEADLVVVGGGIAGTCAAIAAADAGMSVALVQDRPMLGGNASDEIRVRTERAGNEYHWIVKAVKNTSANAEDKKADDANRLACADSAGVSTHLGWRAYGVVTNAQRKIVAVDARNIETGARRRFVAPLYVDATGDGWLGYWAGAAFMLGREAKSEFNEPTHGQDTADTSTMGNSLLWNTKTGSEPYVFPSVPWATKVSGSRADTSGGWTWEAGLDPEEDTIYDAEMLRDRLFRAIYGSFSNAKAKSGNENLVFNWVPYIAGKRESRRIVGDYVVREADVVNTRAFEDSIGIATWSVDLHRKDGNSGFIAATTHHYYPAWWMPYRSLCCRDVPNLFLAGRCASYTHVAFGSSRVMNAGGQQGVAAGYAASLCKKYACRPREIYRDANKTLELQQLINKKNEYAFPPHEAPQERELVSVVVDNADSAGVEISGSWAASSYNSDRYGANYLHNNKVASEDLWVRFTPAIPSNATYVVSLFWNSGDARSTAVPVEIVYDGGVTTNYVNMSAKSSTWNPIGSWPFAEGSSGSVRILTVGQKNLTVIADAVKFAVVERTECPDSDGNGLPDAWERRHFLQTEGTDPAADPDGDGATNLQEFRRGTDPNRPNAPLSISLAHCRR